jgi:serine/threonine-protein kinase
MLSTFAVGQELDHYRIERIVARSGMASIFRGTDLRTGSPVAIKVPHFEMECDLVFFERFQREEQIGRRLDHPAVMKVMENPNRSRVYMVMEWVEGRLLREILAEQPRLSGDRAMRIALQVCEALEHIHSRGVVHRDLKPENIMVDGNDCVKLIDFGIAGLAGARRLTFGKFSQLSGTPDYIAPEQVNGKRGDSRSDIYALGIILYEMLTGALPFQGINALAVMNQRLVSDPIPPHEINPEISPQTEEIIYRALERDPANRYSIAREFADDLANPNRVSPARRPTQPKSKRFAATAWRSVLVYLALAVIPIVIFSAVQYVARHR